MNVFCNRDTCKFQLNQHCRTSAISINQGECTTYTPAEADERVSDKALFWGHLQATPEHRDGDGTS
jgi:hypothetical protein